MGEPWVPPRSRADAFERTAEEYERGRPGWPPEAVERAIAALELDDCAAVVDLAAGTGKLTRELVRRFAHVIAIEPLDGLREVLERVVPEAEALRGTADAIPLADAAVDVVFVAEAFHWFGEPRAVAEIERVLRPGGGLVLMWNVPAGEWEPALPPEVEAVFDRVVARTGRPGLPRYISGNWRGAFEGSGFGDLHDETLANDMIRDRDALVDYWLSISSFAALPDQERASVAEELRRLCPPGTYRLPQRVDLYWTKLRTSAVSSSGAA